MTSLCVGSLNVNNRTYKRASFLQFLAPHDFDILCLQECSDQLGKFLSKQLGMHLVYTPADFGGNALLSKLPFTYKKSIALKPEVSRERRSVAIGTISVPLENRSVFPLSFAALHLDHIEERDRVVQWEQLQRNLPNNTILCGDFNALYRDDYSNDKWRDISNVRQRTHWVPPSSDLMNILLKRLQYRDTFQPTTAAPYPPYTCRFDTRIDWILLPPEHHTHVKYRAVSYEVVDAMHITDHNLVKCIVCIEE